MPASAAPDLDDIDIVILAGGLGMRLREAVPDRPKVLAPVCGKPFLDHLIQWLRRSGARRILLSIGHLGEQVESYVDASDFGGLGVSCIREPAPLGTAGAIRFVTPMLSSSRAMVLNGDSFTNVDLNFCLSEHFNAVRMGTIVCSETESPGDFGTVKIGSNHEFLGFHEKTNTPPLPAYINTGIYIFEEAMLQLIDRLPGASLERDVFETLPAGSLNVVAGAFDFIDIGAPARYQAADQYFQRLDS